MENMIGLAWAKYIILIKRAGTKDIDLHNRIKRLYDQCVILDTSAN